MPCLNSCYERSERQMDNQSELQAVAPILKYYSIQPNFVENFGRVRRIYSDKGVFALKKISPKHGTEFIRHVQQLYQNGYNRIVPIYPTLDGRYAVLYQNDLYYLMPWLSNEVKEDRNERHQQMFRELARLHTLSAREIPVNKEDKQQHYENTIHDWEKESELLEGFIVQCEGKFYLSPFELLFYQYYFNINQALQYSKRKFEDWYEKTKEKEKARVVLSHGKISTEHFIYDDRGYGYFTNFEKSNLGSPMHDLLPFISRTLTTLPKQNEECVEWLYTYFKYFPLKEDEMLLFSSYLAHPGHIIRCVEEYHKSQKKDERKQVFKLQKQYWLLKNTEYLVMRMDEIEKQKKQALEAAKAKAEAQEGAQSD